MATGICPWCGKEVDKFIMFRGDVVGCRYCGIHTKQTNADRIRAMSDDEMAKMCYTELGCPKWRGYPDCGKTPSASACTRCWFDWLRQEVET